MMRRRPWRLRLKRCWIAERHVAAVVGAGGGRVSPDDGYYCGCGIGWDGRVCTRGNVTRGGGTVSGLP